MSKSIQKLNIEIADGDAVIYETVDYMWNYALRDAKTQEAKDTAKKLRGKTKIETIENIYNWVRRLRLYDNAFGLFA